MLNPSALENSHAASKLAASMGIAIQAVDAWSLSRSQVDNLLAQNTGHGCRRTLRLDAADMCSENLTIWESKQLIQRRARKSGTIARDPLSGSINNAWPACCCPTTRAARRFKAAAGENWRITFHKERDCASLGSRRKYYYNLRAASKLLLSCSEARARTERKANNWCESFHEVAGK